jgi:GNAT superfamily N-acetyltransferase
VAVAAYEADGWLRPGDTYRAALADAATRAREAELLVAVDGDGRVLGTVTVCLPGTPWAEVCQPGEVEFRILAVDPPARGRGVGAVLVDAVIQGARNLGVARVVLSSTVGMLSAQRIYQSMGFIRLPDRDWRPRPDIHLIAFGLDLAS